VGKKDSKDSVSFEYKAYPDVTTERWSDIHSIPIRRFICPTCNIPMFTSRPFILKEKKESDTSWVGLTTEDNGKHDCGEDSNISVAKFITDSTAESVFNVMRKKLLKSGK